MLTGLLDLGGRGVALASTLVTVSILFPICISYHHRDIACTYMRLLG
jgi:hypothetical protein